MVWINTDNLLAKVLQKQLSQMKSRNWIEIAIIRAIISSHPLFNSQQTILSDVAIVAATSEQQIQFEKLIPQIQCYTLDQI